MITRSEWDGDDRSFANHDWNGNGVLSGDEVRPGATKPRAEEMRAAALMVGVVVALLGIACDDAVTTPHEAAAGAEASTGLNLTGTWVGTAATRAVSSK